MSFTISPTQDDLTRAVGLFLVDVLPSGVLPTVSNPNRVGEPKVTSFVVMHPLRFTRISTNIDAYADVKFTASTSDGVMTVTEVQIGKIYVGGNLFGEGLPIPTLITSQISGDPGDVGEYVINSDTDLPSQTFSGGGFTMKRSSEVVLQLDFHSADRTSVDNAQVTSTAFRDEYGVNFFSALDAPLNQISPLYADDPVQRPFINDQQQFEWVWMLETHLQVDQVVRAPMQYADLVQIGLFPVELQSVDDLSLDYSNPSNSQYFPGL